MSNTVNNYTETDLGNISLNPRGEYDDSAAYEYLDTVSYRGGSYFCLAELETTITGIAPDAGRNSEYWQMIAAPGDMTPEYTAAHNDVIKKAVQVETSRVAVELAQQEIEAVQTDVQQLHSDTARAAQETENSKNSAANFAQSAEQSRKTVSESEQNIKGQIAGFDSRVSEAVEQSKEEINTTKQQAINTITNQQTTSVNTVKTEGEKIITRVGNDAKTVADDRATVEEATQTVLNNAQEVAQNTQTVASNTEKAAASAEGAKTSADNAAQSAKSVEDASKQIEQNKKDVDSLKEDMTSKADKTALVKTDRKLDALWKLNQGISYEFQTDTANAYQKTVPSGAKVASVKSIGGKTIVWNQLLGTGYEDTKTANGITFTNNGDGSITIDGTAATDATFQINSGRSFALYGGHAYLWNVGKTVDGVVVGNVNYTQFYKKKVAKWTFEKGQYYGYNCIKVVSGTTVSNLTIKPQLFDLTIMFGLGNEPSTVEEFEAMFPADYYPYNAGKLMSVPVNEVVEQGKNLFDQNKESNLLRCSLDGDNIVKTDVSLRPILKIDGLKIGTIYTISYNTVLKASLSMDMLLYSLSTKETAYPSGDFKHEVGTGKTDYNVKFSFSAPQETMYLIGSIMSETISKFQVEESSSITEYKPYHKISHSILQAVLKLDGYGDGIDDVCNYADWENKKYHKRIGRYVVTGDEQFYSNQTYIGDNSSNAYMDMDIGQKQSTDAKLISNKLLYSKWCWSEDRTYDAICLNNTQIHIRISNSSLGITNEASPVETQNATKKYCKNLHESGDPIIIYYELAEEEIIDISDIIGDTFQKPLEVESGGTLMFRNTNGDDYRIPVPNTEEYLVSLAEVAK